MSDPADELVRLIEEVNSLGKQIEQRRLRALELLKGKKAKSRRGDEFIVDQVRVQQGGMRSFRFWAEGPRLKADGSPHARTRDSLIL